MRSRPPALAGGIVQLLVVTCLAALPAGAEEHFHLFPETEGPPPAGLRVQLEGLPPSTPLAALHGSPARRMPPRATSPAADVLPPYPTEKRLAAAALGVPARAATDEVPQPPTPSAEAPASEEAPRPAGTLIRNREAPSGEQEAAPRPDNTPLTGTLTGFIAFPGTKVLFKPGGLVRLQLVSTSKAVGEQDKWVTSSIPVKGQSGYNTGEQFNANANQSRINLDVRATTPFGPLRVYYENDFSDTSGQSFAYHIRHFYVQVANFFAGYGNSTLVNVDAAAETLDLQGPNGAVKKRHAQARYTAVLARGSGSATTLAVSLEDPGSEVPSSLTPRSAAPDGVVALRWEGRHGHIQLGGLARSIGYQDSSTGAGQAVFGWAVSLAGDLNLGARDHVSGQVAGGEGAGAYFADTAGGHYDAALTQGGQLRALPIIGGFAAFTHFWSDRWRSSVSYGYLALDDTAYAASLGAAAFQRSQYASANVLWTPSRHFFIGLEGLYGTNKVISGSAGEAWRMMLNAQYSF